MLNSNPGALFIIDPKAEFNNHIDAPVETEVELQHEGILQHRHHHHGHGHFGRGMPTE